MCGCNGGAQPTSSTVYTVEANGKTKTFDSEPDARVYASVNNGRVIISKK